jgi:hypothetical protein
VVQVRYNPKATASGDVMDWLNLNATISRCMLAGLVTSMVSHIKD